MGGRQCSLQKIMEKDLEHERVTYRVRELPELRYQPSTNSPPLQLTELTDSDVNKKFGMVVFQAQHEYLFTTRLFQVEGIKVCFTFCMITKEETQAFRDAMIPLQPGMWHLLYNLPFFCGPVTVTSSWKYAPPQRVRYLRYIKRLSTVLEKQLYGAAVVCVNRPKLEAVAKTLGFKKLWRGRQHPKVILLHECARPFLYHLWKDRKPQRWAGHGPKYNTLAGLSATKLVRDELKALLDRFYVWPQGVHFAYQKRLFCDAFLYDDDITVTRQGWSFHRTHIPLEAVAQAAWRTCFRACKLLHRRNLAKLLKLTDEANRITIDHQRKDAVQLVKSFWHVYEGWLLKPGWCEQIPRYSEQQQRHSFYTSYAITAGTRNDFSSTTAYTMHTADVVCKMLFGVNLQQVVSTKKNTQ